MTTPVDHLPEAYARLCQILQRPQAFGLGANVPEPLAESLEAVLRALGQAMDESKEPIPGGDLAAELSQDSDRIVPANS